MRILLGFAVACVAAFAGLLLSEANSSFLDDASDKLIGQATYQTANSCNRGQPLPSADTLCGPRGGVTVDDLSLPPPGTRRLFVADTGNNRVLGYDNPFTADTTADYVFGTNGDFEVPGDCAAVPAGQTICNPRGVAYDPDNHGLYVSDTDHNRILVFLYPHLDSTADYVIGQSDFSGTSCNRGLVEPSVETLCQPHGLDFRHNRLYIADKGNNRVLVLSVYGYQVFGQADFDDSSPGLSATKLDQPSGVAVASFPSATHVYVADTGNNRVVRFAQGDLSPPPSNYTATQVFGQPDFTSEACNNGGVSSQSLCQPIDVATASDTTDLFVSDTNNNRVLLFTNPSATDNVADAVYGQQGDFTASTCLELGTAQDLCEPHGLAVSGDSVLYVGEYSEHRVQGYALCTDAVNTDRNYIDQSPPYAPSVDDRTWINSDRHGDACDTDDDNDGRSDADEASGAGCTGIVTNPLLRDTDGDRYLDGAECALGSNPASGASFPSLASCGAAGDADADKVATRVEVCFYNSNPAAADTDGDAAQDGAKDGCEVASFNIDRIVNSLDQGMLAQGILGYVPYTVNVDINKDGVLNSIDQGLQAQFIVPPGQCPEYGP